MTVRSSRGFQIFKADPQDYQHLHTESSGSHIL